MLRLLVPLAGIVSFFLLSLVTVRAAQAADSRGGFFLAMPCCCSSSRPTSTRASGRSTRSKTRAGLVCCLLLQMLMCLTMWNGFYSLLWGFSGGLMYDLYNEHGLRERGSPGGVVRAATGVDRMLARRLPNLEAGGWLELRDGTLRLKPKGRAIAFGTLASFKVFSLGMGGGVK